MLKYSRPIALFNFAIQSAEYPGGIFSNIFWILRWQSYLINKIEKEKISEEC